MCHASAVSSYLFDYETLAKLLDSAHAVRMIDGHQDYNATADYFERKAAKARDEAVRERFSRIAAKYRAKAREQAEQQSRPTRGASVRRAPGYPSV